MKTFGLIGYKGKIGSILASRSGFVSIDCDITDLNSIYDGSYAAFGEEQKYDVIVNCAAISSIDKCEKEYEKAIKVNVRGLSHLHQVFGQRILNISSDYVFDDSWWPKNEKAKQGTINLYGFSKFGAEGVSEVFGGKTIRLARSISHTDPDFAEYIDAIAKQESVRIPHFFVRNYIHRNFVADAIEYFVNNWDSMPSMVNYGGTESISLGDLFFKIASKITPNLSHMYEEGEYYPDPPRPKRLKLNVNLAKKLGFPMHDISDTVSELLRGVV